jgi:hypothetical protein
MNFVGGHQARWIDGKQVNCDTPPFVTLEIGAWSENLDPAKTFVCLLASITICLLVLRVSHFDYAWLLARSLDYQLGTPRGRYDEHNNKFSLSKKPRFNQPVGERNHF